LLNGNKITRNDQCRNKASSN